MTRVRTGARVPPDGSTHLAPGVVSETLDEGRIVIFTFTDGAIPTIDAAIEALGDLMRRCDEAGWPLRVLLDLSQPDVIPTPYARERATALTRARPRLRGRVALLAQEGTPVAHQVARVLRSTLYQYRERSLFFHREQALGWLRAQPERAPLS